MLIFFSQEADSLAAQYKDSFAVQQLSDFAAWERNRIVPAAFVIAGSDKQYFSSIAGKIRRDSEVFASLCFSTELITSPDNALLDGLLPPAVDLQKAIDTTNDLLKSLKGKENYLTHQGRLIKYLWLRPHLVLQPQHEWNNPRFYRYPLLEALSLDQADSFEWLRNLTNAKILEAVSLVDRQRECMYCRSSHLRFIDICPNCSAIDIKLQPSLHCFTCGCVDAQDKFLQSGSLVCPKCHTHLRHIGSDYDRPLENYHCQACHQSFMEGDVQVRCAMCEKEMNPNDLILNEVHAWRLSDKGRTIAFRGEVFDLSSGFDQLDFISRELFIHDLNWMMVMTRRYPAVKFSLFGIYFANLPELVEVFNHTRLLQMLESFAQRLRNLLRTPDLSTRTSENMLWLLLPNTDEYGLTGFQKRMEKSMDQLLEESDYKLNFRFISMHSQKLPQKESAELLLARLVGELL
ncbi:MAG: GGDEF domain-containing protein [Nitrosomonas sp.]|nr:MAG: GGDEF domain-containing protein [Nitrosomonas sp.]